MSDSLFDKVEQSQSLPGWCGLIKARTLAALVLALRPSVSVEIGVFGGRGFAPMALAHREVGGIVIGIDPWDSKASIEGQLPKDVEWWGQLDHSMIEHSFRSYLHQSGLENVAKIIKARSDDVEPPAEIGLLSIDGNHSEVSVRDARRFGSRVKEGGICVVDDLNWATGGPFKSLATLESLGFVELYRVFNKDKGGMDDWAVYQRGRQKIRPYS